MKNSYIPNGVCSTLIEYEVKDNKLISLNVTNGCNGNLKGISKLCVNRDIDEIISLLEGIKCGFKNTSCPDQIAKALKDYKKTKDI